MIGFIVKLLLIVFAVIIACKGYIVKIDRISSNKTIIEWGTEDGCTFMIKIDTRRCYKNYRIEKKKSRCAFVNCKRNTKFYEV